MRIPTSTTIFQISTVIIFYEYCTVTLPVEYREVTGKEVSEEMMIEFHVFKPLDYKSMESEDIHIINLTEKKIERLVISKSIAGNQDNKSGYKNVTGEE